MKELSKDKIKAWDEKMIDENIEKQRKLIFELKMTKSVSPIKKPHHIGILKKNLARLLTAKNKGWT